MSKELYLSKNPKVVLARVLHGMKNPIFRIARKHKVTQSEFLKAHGISSYNLFVTWGYGIVERPRVKTIKDIAKALKTEPIKLMGDVQSWMGEDWKHDPISYIHNNIEDID